MLVHQSRRKHRVVADVCQFSKSHSLSITNMIFRMSTVGRGSCGKERCVSCANTEVIVNTITIFVSWVPLVLPLCGSVRAHQIVSSVLFFCISVCIVSQSGLCHKHSVAPTSKLTKLAGFSAGHVMATTNICGRLLSCLSTFATTMWVFTKRRTICFGEFCGPNVVERFGGGHVVFGVVRRCQHCRHLEVQFWLCSSVGRVTSICAVALQRNTKQKPSTNTKKRLFVCGVCEVVRDSSHYFRSWPCLTTNVQF